MEHNDKMLPMNKYTFFEALSLSLSTLESSKIYHKDLHNAIPYHYYLVFFVI